MSLTREALCKCWPKLDGPLALLEQWDTPRGLLFESDDASAYEAVLAVAKLLGGHVEKFEPHPVLKRDWEARAGIYLNGQVPSAGLFQTGKTRLVIIVLDLERQPNWLQHALKRPLDGQAPSAPAIRILATTADAGQIPSSVRSVFPLVRKTGRRRGSTAV